MSRFVLFREQGSAKRDSHSAHHRERKANAPWHRDCSVAAMMAILNITLALIAAGLVVELFAAATAPMGYQDDNGFHVGPEKIASNDEAHSGKPQLVASDARSAVQ